MIGGSASKRCSCMVISLLLLSGLPAMADQEGALRPVDERWAERLAAAKAEVETLRKQVRAAGAAYTRARRDDHPRGEALQKLVEEWHEHRAAYREAKERLPELVEQARREGVYPVVLRPYEMPLDADEPVEPASNDASEPRKSGMRDLDDYASPDPREP